MANFTDNTTQLQSLLAKVNELPEAIDTSDATAIASDVLSGKTAYVNGQKITGNIATKTSSNLTVSGATVTVPAGYYASQATKSVTKGRMGPPMKTSVSTTGLVSITPSIDNPGYMTQNDMISSTYQLNTQAGKTVAPSNSVQTVVEAGRYTTGAIKVSAIRDVTMGPGDISVNSSGLVTAQHFIESPGYITQEQMTPLTLQLTTQAAKTITPTKSSQTAVAKNVYTTGAVTVAAIPDQYQDVSGVTATAARTAAGDVFVDADGVEQTGKLRTDQIAILNPAEGSIIEHVNTIGSTGIIGTHVTISSHNFGSVTPDKVLAGETFTSFSEYDGGLNQKGTMPNNGTVSTIIDGLETKTVAIPEGYTSGGTVTVDNTVDNIANTQADLLKQIENALQRKSVSGGGSSSGDLETCTVTITRNSNASGFIGDVYYTTVENDTIVAKCENVGTGKTITCICNSLIAIDESGARVGDTCFGMTRVLSSQGSNFAFGAYNIRIFFITAYPNENIMLEVQMD